MSASGKLVVWVGFLESPYEYERDCCLGIPLKSQATNLPLIDDVRNFTSDTLNLYPP